MTENLLKQEREHLDALLKLTPFIFHESKPTPGATQLRALAGWRFTTANQTAEADIYVFDTYERIQAAIGELITIHASKRDNQPMVSQNGPLVFVVHRLNNSNDGQILAQALAGEEE